MTGLFGRERRVVQNNFRGEVVEEIVAKALGEAWCHCSEGTSPIRLQWRADPDRHSEIYLFASHEIDDESTNHFDPAQ